MYTFLRQDNIQSITKFKLQTPKCDKNSRADTFQSYTGIEERDKRARE